MNKNNYVIHYRNLQQYLELGMKLKKIHKILKFKQSDWMRPYFDFNTDERKESTKESDKTIENLRKRIKIRVVKNCKVKTLLNIHQDQHALIGKYLKTI